MPSILLGEACMVTMNLNYSASLVPLMSRQAEVFINFDHRSRLLVFTKDLLINNQQTLNTMFGNIR